MEYLTVENECAATYEIRRSVFICSVKGVDNFDKGMEFVRKISKKYSDATHNCYAINCLDTRKFSDDGEPQGTAGQPIMQTLIKKNLTNVAAVVTRYFGGIKLGAGGLVASYTKAVCDALDNAEIVTVKESSVGKINADYTEYRLISETVKSFGTVINTEFGDGAEIKFAVPTGFENALNDRISQITAGRTQPVYTGKEYIKYF